MKIRDTVYISFFVALTITGAFIRIPLPFLSITFQALFALLAGIILGPLRGMLTMAIYMLIGLLGIPVFSLGGGIGYVLQPSFGFILGFIPGAFIAGLLYDKSVMQPYLKVLFSYFGGMLVVYAIGVSYMYVILKFYIAKPDVSLTATAVSMFPYIIKDIILALLASSMGKFIPHLRYLTEKSK